ncbi:MAG: winged helix-turn-helix domain-containing protein [Methylococcales bacterium]|nr:winged helix-turn-helix domain-containing protein [Methylobacter sp.]MDZ4154958.1 winged helix-turn-helix domain-containing protein [Methylococcales bacterium]MDP2097478.1 winged helix-turn-helix domain-containing protein [Methylobacter sp.]MDP2426669.1 winged helix-turn-helix domain-containing protein [Methylobacter sp.]MDP3055336.1 winged helix-turn-helix domain-containing protein [Methylobacter sp.]
MKKTTTTAKPTSTPKPSTTKATKKTLEAAVATTAKETAIKTPVTEAPIVVPVTVEVAEKKAPPEPSKSTKVSKTSAQPKLVKKAPVVNAEPVVSVPELAMNERIGLTAGSIWHYLAKNGETSVVKLVNAIPEQEDVIQRSIGWLAMEGKITFTVVDYLEVIVLKD